MSRSAATTQQLSSIRRRFFTLPLQRVWPAADETSITLQLNLQAQALQGQQDQESLEYHGREPHVAADVDDILAWRDEGRALEARHAQEQLDFSTKRAEIEADLQNLVDLTKNYDDKYTQCQTAYEAVWSNTEPSLGDILEEEVAARSGKVVDLDDLREKIVKGLRALGVNHEYGIHFTDAHDHIVASVRDLAYATRHIPQDEPEVPVRPDEPAKPEIVTPRSIKDKITFVSLFWDLLMLIGGAGLGSSIGTALGAILFDSDGWHFQPAFYACVVLGMILSFAMGKAVFPVAISFIRLRTVNIYPYFKDSEWLAQQAKARKVATLCIALLVAIFALCGYTDFYGWHRAIIEQNAAVEGDSGAIWHDPNLAGFAAIFITSAFMACKLFYLNSLASRQEDELSAEVQRKAVQFRNSVGVYDKQVGEYDRLMAARDAYLAKAPQAESNVVHRMSGGDATVIEVLSNISKYHNEVDRPLSDEVRECVEKALQKVKNELAEMEEAEKRVDTVHNRFDQLFTADVSAAA